ncbi:QWRF motif-containing protein 2 [Striga hermonthica]|uniref:QWRF motif-containing protein 2 n=1 Tax=Striga hermonthica TaxID=68872 RepID=A0A9N7RIA8_STRHE|nr:QWRF motif-containing protein 2 [Striga hermonthica]
MVDAVSRVASEPQNPKAAVAASQDEKPMTPPVLQSEKDNNYGKFPFTFNHEKLKKSFIQHAFLAPGDASSSKPQAARPFLPDLDTAKNGHILEISSATRLFVTSTRSLSVSFQGEAFSLPISKTKVTPNLNNSRKGTPERRSNSIPSRTKVDGSGNHVKNYKPSDQHQRGLSGIGWSQPLHYQEASTVLVSSDSTTGVQECSPKEPRGLAVSACFWQETNSRLRRLQDPGLPLSTSPGSKLVVLPKLKRYSSDVPLMSPSRTLSSPRAPTHKACFAPEAHEPGGLIPFAGPQPVMDEKCEAEVGENRIVDAYLLRLLYNRHVQWRFVNARTEDALLLQNHGAEVEEVNCLVTELAEVTSKERALLEQCTGFISLLAAMQVEDSSLRTHIIQRNCVR